jgi:hypothetical protein
MRPDRVPGEEMIPCPKCGKPFPEERRDLGFGACIACTPQGERPLGVVVYDHKTGGVLEVCNRDQFEAIKSHNDPSKDKDLEDFTP